jgi:hypothetical protein
MKDVKLPINVNVSYAAGAYNTAAVIGQRASSTCSAQAAMERLVGKLTEMLKLPAGRIAAAPVPAKGLKPGSSMWKIDVAAFLAVGADRERH